MFKRKKIKERNKSKHYSNERAQSAVEYMLLFATVMIVVMYSFDSFFPFLRESANLYYNGVVIGITGKTPPDFCLPAYSGSVGCGGY